jgi:hypothetical protein
MSPTNPIARYFITTTFVPIRTPSAFQRTTAVIVLVTMIVLGLFLSPPMGFEWLLPVYFLTLLVGVTAKDSIAK